MPIADERQLHCEQRCRKFKFSKSIITRISMCLINNGTIFRPDVEIVGQSESEADRKFLTVQKVFGV